MTRIKDWPLRQRQLYRKALHQAMLSQDLQPLFFDEEQNWHGEERPANIKKYWQSLSDTERAFEILQGTDAAIFMQFHDRILNSIPKPPIAP